MPQVMTTKKNLLTENSNPDKPLTLAHCLEVILEALDASSEEDREITYDASKEFAYVCSTLDLTKEQAIIFAAIVENSFGSSPSPETIARRLGCTNLHFLELGNDIEVLIDKRYIRSTSDSFTGKSYYVPGNVMRSIQKNEKPNCDDISNLSPSVLFRKMSNEFRDFWRDNSDLSSLQHEIEALLKYNEQNSFVKELKSKGLLDIFDDELLVYLYMLIRYSLYDESEFTWDDFGRIFANDIEEDYIKDGFENGEATIQRKGLVEFVNNNGIADNTRYCLTNTSINEVLRSVPIKRESDTNNKSVINHTVIKQKPLFYNKEEESQIETLIDLLQKDNFNKVVERLKKKGLRTGFNVIFTGPAGTGKTESAYQIARKTGRDIFLVDVSSLKSKWVGDSEKQVRALFQEYRRIVNLSEVCPILLFNEADAIFGIRKKGAENAVDKMENAIQNIILQEMENLEGIMIATTNLTCNFDSAFERRFIYKVQFQKPDTDAKTKIWGSMIEGLSEDNARELASEFDLSGGQIENISRKMTVDYILYGKEPEIQSIKDFCNQEKFESQKKPRTRIGF